MLIYYQYTEYFSKERYVEQMVFERQGLSIHFTPRVNVQPPATVNGLYKALSCILQALDGIHHRGLMHRDLRWDNVGHEIGKTDENADWFLLDFDEAVGFPQTVGVVLNPKSHAPEIGVHTQIV